MRIPEPEYPYSIAVNEYGFYCLPEVYKSREVPQVSSAGGVYEPDTIRLMRRLCHTGDIVAGGSFVGDFLPALGAGLSPEAMLHTFEPNPISRAAAEMTIALNGLKRVTLHSCAVGASEGVLPLQVAKPSGEAMAARARIADAPAAGETIDVPVKRLDDLVPLTRRVAVLQLDIEGHESPALDGAPALISAHRPVIVLEAPRAWQQRAYAEKLARLFPTLTYRFCGALERNAVFRSL
ncbi:FkbM family methyltransferase [Sagittula salina]|uniref:FkbM family methyltransferase n=1 Tax=Sagittula salina TaxID=2820268 RepID=A0A940MQS1_9RHOB|nr:FkbM family methyltransferase [Sagittula salina]MBP0481349.1 FkbM family methyltransferase [Sagittula salina]